MRDEDLAPFAVAEGLLAKMANQEPGRATDDERQWMLDKARENLARVLNVSWTSPAGNCTPPPRKAT